MVVMPALHQGWNIYVMLSDNFPFTILSLIFHVQGKLMERVTRCQCCQTLHHECYSLATRFAVGANMTRTLLMMWLLRVSFLFSPSCSKFLNDCGRSSAHHSSLGPSYGGPDQACDSAQKGCHQGKGGHLSDRLTVCRQSDSCHQPFESWGKGAPEASGKSCLALPAPSD